MGSHAEEEIRVLCRRLLRTGDPAEVQLISDELQRAIHNHVEDLRLKVLSSMGVPPKHTVT